MQPDDFSEAVDADIEAVDDLPITKDYKKKALNPELLDDEINDGNIEYNENKSAADLENVLDEIVGVDSNEIDGLDPAQGFDDQPDEIWSTLVNAADEPETSEAESRISLNQEEPADASLKDTGFDLDNDVSLWKSIDEQPAPVFDEQQIENKDRMSESILGISEEENSIEVMPEVSRLDIDEQTNQSASNRSDKVSENILDITSQADSEQALPEVSRLNVDSDTSAPGTDAELSDSEEVSDTGQLDLDSIESPEDKITVVDRFLASQGVTAEEMEEIPDQSKLELFDKLVQAQNSEEQGAAEPPPYMAARRANLGGPNEVPIDMHDPREGIDEINLPLTAFNQLQYGQSGFIAYSVRQWPGFRERSNAWLRARKAGTDIDYAKKRGWHLKILDFFKYGYAYMTVAMQDPRKGKSEKPVPPWQKHKDLTPLPSSAVDPDEKQAWKDASDKSGDTVHFEVTMRIGVYGSEEDAEAMEHIVADVANGMNAFNTTHQQIVWEQGHAQDSLLCNMGPEPPKEPRMILSSKEMAVLAHPCDDMVKPNAIKVSRSHFKQLPMANPIYIDDPYKPPKGIIPIGVMNAHSRDEAVIGMRNKELDKHMITTGKTGSGKSEWLKWLIHGIVEDDYPMVLIDPHGQLADEVLNSLVINSESRHDDIAYVDISDEKWPVAMNPLDISSYEAVDGTVGSVMQMLSSPKVNLASGGAPRAVVYAKEALIALCHANIVLEDPLTKCTLLDVLSFFQDPDFRRLVIECCKNPSIRDKYDADRGPFELMGEKMQIEHTQALTRAFSELANSSAFQAVFSSPENKLSFANLISQNKIVIIKLSRFGGGGQGELGAFVGSLVLPWLLSSMTEWGRTKDPITQEERGRGCRVIVDEAPTMMGPGSSVPETLAEARKWDLGLIMAAQFLQQFDASIIDAALVNTNSKISLVQDPNMAGSMTKAIAGSSSRVQPSDLAQLPNFHFYGNVLMPTEIGASNSGPFSAACLPMINHKLSEENIKAREEIIAKSRAVVANDAQMIAELAAKRKENIMDGLSNYLREQNVGKLEDNIASQPGIFEDSEDDGDLWG